MPPTKLYILRNFLNHILVKIFLVLPEMRVENSCALDLRAASRARSPGLNLMMI